MRDGPWKLVTQAKGLSGGPALFNVAEDISESNDLAAQQPDRVRQMLAEIEAWKRDIAADITPQPEMQKFIESGTVAPKRRGKKPTNKR